MFEMVNELARRMESQLSLYPALNVWEEDERFVVEAEVPGVKAEGVELQVLDGSLALKVTREAPEAHYLRRERAAGTFVRTLDLPAGLDVERVDATLKDGVLTIALPKAEAAKPRRIPVKIS